jgi:hypothetical protein
MAIAFLLPRALAQWPRQSPLAAVSQAKENLSLSLWVLGLLLTGERAVHQYCQEPTGGARIPAFP